MEPHLVSIVYIDGRQSSKEPSVRIVRGLEFRRVLAEHPAKPSPFFIVFTGSQAYDVTICKILNFIEV